MPFILAIVLLIGLAVGFQQVTVNDGSRPPLAVDIWYPSGSPPALQSIGPFQQDVALDAPLVGGRLPLVLISDGTGGSLASHYDMVFFRRVRLSQSR